MRYSLVGFNQRKIIELNEQYKEQKIKCDIIDLHILEYIIHANGNPDMKHLTKDEVSYVWIEHKHFIEDLPELYITAGTFGNRLTKLKKMGLIQSETIANQYGRGTKTYYSITSFCNDMLYDKETTTSRNNDVKTRPHHEFVTSNNKLNNDNKLNNTITINSNSRDSKEFLSNSKKPPKKSMYSKCIDLINDFTDNDYLRELLEKFLKICIQNAKDGNYPFYVNHFKGKLNRLQELSDNTYEQIDIAQEAVKNGYSKFYKIKSVNKPNKSMKTVNGKFQDNIEPDRRDTTGKEFEVVNEGF